MANEVRNNPDRKRYELLVDGQLVGVADYEDYGNFLVFPHTEIDPRRRGQGLGEVLIRGAMDDVRQRLPQAKVRPLCWFVRDFLDNNAEYTELKAS